MNTDGIDHNTINPVIMNPDPVHLPPSNPIIINDPYSQYNVIDRPVNYVSSREMPVPDQNTETPSNQFI